MNEMTVEHHGHKVIEEWDVSENVVEPGFGEWIILIAEEGSIADTELPAGVRLINVKQGAPFPVVVRPY